MKKNLIFSLGAGIIAGFISWIIPSLRVHQDHNYSLHGSGQVDPGAPPGIADYVPGLFEDKLKQAGRLYRGEGVYDRRGFDLLNSCVQEWKGLPQLKMLGEIAHLLPFSIPQLNSIAGRMASELTLLDNATVLLHWRCQQDAEYLFHRLPEGLCADLAATPGLVSGIFGARAAVISEEIWENSYAPALDRVCELLVEGSLSAVTFGVLLRKNMESLDGKARLDAINQISAIFPRLSRGMQEAAWHSICLNFSADEISLHVGKISRLGNPDLFLQAYGAAMARSAEPAAEFLEKMNSWDSEPSRRVMLQGFLSAISELGEEDAHLLKSQIDDAEMVNAIDLRALELKASREGPSILVNSKYDKNRKTDIALLAMKNWPDETMRLALDGVLDTERIVVWRKSNPLLFPLTDETSARLNKWTAQHAR